jgi:hypothetical protein
MLFHSLLFPFLVAGRQIILSNVQTVSESIHSCGRIGDVFELKSIWLNPDPPERGQQLEFSIEGTLKADIKQGAVVHVRAKLGFIQLINQDMDLCEKIKQVGRECPIPKGPFLLNHTVEIPKEAPPGKYSVWADIKNFDSAHVACAEGSFRM